MVNVWSRDLFLKVFGGVFFLCGTAGADVTAQYDRALEAARRAFIIQSGIKRELDEKKRSALQKVKTTLQRQQLLEELTLIGGVVNIARERGLKIKYEGVDYLIGPLQIRVIIHL
jgi:hypothetical protein